MVADIEARLADVRSEIERQNEQWKSARRALMRLGGEPIAVPRELLRQLDVLAQPRAAGVHGLRG